MNRKILFQGNFSKTDITCTYNEISSQKIDVAIEEKTKIIWQQKLDEATNAGKKMWDQLVYRLDNFTLKGDKCALVFSTIPFSIRSSIKDFTDDLVKKGDDYLPKAIYSSIFIETADGKFVFGEKSDKFMANRKYSYIGGVFNKPQDIKQQADIFDESVKEITEELGIENSDTDQLQLLGAFRSESCNVAFIFYCKLKLNKAEVLEKFKIQNDQELKSLFFSTRDELRDVNVNKIGKEPELLDIFEHNSDE